MILTNEIIKRCIPKNFIVTSKTIADEHPIPTTKAATMTCFSIEIPLGGIGFVISQNSRGRVYIHEKWNYHESKHFKIIPKLSSEEQLCELICSEIKRQTTP